MLYSMLVKLNIRFYVLSRDQIASMDGVMENCAHCYVNWYKMMFLSNIYLFG